LADADVPPLLRQFQWIDLRGGDVEKGVSAIEVVRVRITEAGRRVLG
jgi:hypothetical protein